MAASSEGGLKPVAGCGPRHGAKGDLSTRRLADLAQVDESTGRQVEETKPRHGEGEKAIAPCVKLARFSALEAEKTMKITHGGIDCGAGARTMGRQADGTTRNRPSSFRRLAGRFQSSCRLASGVSRLARCQAPDPRRKLTPCPPLGGEEGATAWRGRVSGGLRSERRPCPARGRRGRAGRACRERGFPRISARRTGERAAGLSR